MSSDDFERGLHRLFADSPALSDDASFTGRVQQRLEQAQSVRRLVIGVVGGLGAAVATAQILSANLGQRLTEVGSEGAQAWRSGWRLATQDADSLLMSVPLPGEVLWTAAALAAVAIGMLATRMSDPL